MFSTFNIFAFRPNTCCLLQSAMEPMELMVAGGGITRKPSYCSAITTFFNAVVVVNLYWNKRWRQVLVGTLIPTDLLPWSCWTSISANSKWCWLSRKFQRLTNVVNEEIIDDQVQCWIPSQRCWIALVKNLKDFLFQDFQWHSTSNHPRCCAGKSLTLKVIWHLLYPDRWWGEHWLFGQRLWNMLVAGLVPKSEEDTKDFPFLLCGNLPTTQTCQSLTRPPQKAIRIPL